MELNKIHVGDARILSRQLDSESIDCVITSPPYYNIRDYNESLQIGLEPEPEIYINELRNVFTEIYRAVKQSGSIWVNIADCYISDSPPKDAITSHTETIKCRVAPGSILRAQSSVLPAKSKVGIPYMFRLMMNSIGYISRQDIIWKKEAAMPYTGKDRFRNQHEYLFHFVKSPSYYFDQKPAMLRAHKNWSETEENYILIGDVWDIPPGTKSWHCASFPEELIVMPLLCSCPPGSIVFDPFIGSGTVAKVARTNARNWIGFEISNETAKIAMDDINELIPF